MRGDSTFPGKRSTKESRAKRLLPERARNRRGTGKTGKASFLETNYSEK